MLSSLSLSTKTQALPSEARSYLVLHVHQKQQFAEIYWGVLVLQKAGEQAWRVINFTFENMQGLLFNDYNTITNLLV